MARIEIYTTQFCPYCYRAKALLDDKGAAYVEYDTMADSERRAEARSRSGGRTSVPQIFINGQHIGGCDELHELDAAGRLDPLLAGSG